MRRPDPVVVPFPRDRIVRIRRKPQIGHGRGLGHLLVVRW